MHKAHCIVFELSQVLKYKIIRDKDLYKGASYANILGKTTVYG